MKFNRIALAFVVCTALAVPGLSQHGADDPPGDDRGGLGVSGSGKGGDDNSGGRSGDDASKPAVMQKTQVPLAVSAAGMQLSASGLVDIRSMGGRERLKVTVEANAPDGTVLRVFANGVELGLVTLQRGEGQLERETEDGTPLAGGFLPSGVTAVRVTKPDGTPVLDAQFGASIGAGAADRRFVALSATPAGAAVNATGLVEVRTQGIRRVKVRVETNLPDNTPLSLFAGATPAGTALVRFGEAQFELNDDDGGTFIGQISKVSVVTAKAVVLLEGSL